MQAFAHSSSSYSDFTSSSPSTNQSSFTSYTSSDYESFGFENELIGSDLDFEFSETGDILDQSTPALVDYVQPEENPILKALSKLKIGLFNGKYIRKRVKKLK